jgi:hypothetical protein
MAIRTMRTRPHAIEASLPATLAAVPSSAMTVVTTAGVIQAACTLPAATKARKATAQPRSAFISQVCTQ